MNRRALAIIPAVLLCCAGFCQRANSQTGPARKNSDASVSGRITIKGKPAAGVVVGLRLSQYDPGRVDPGFKATTDQDGKYRITDVPAGSYQVAPVTPAFVISDVNKSYGQNLIIAEGDNITGIDFDLMRGGVITGKVTDADGHPVMEERLALLAADPRSGASHVWVNFQTDDRGIYRMFGIRPGRYKVSIGEDNFGAYNGFGTGRSLPITFYPDAPDAATARVIEIGEGDEATNIDITIAPANQTFSVSGRVMDGETGKPIPNVTISLSKILIIDSSSSSSSGGGTDVRSNPDGAFRLEKLAAGKYSVSIQPPTESDLRAEPITFDLIDQDVTGLLIKTATGASLSGTVLLEGPRDRGPVGTAPAWLSVHLRKEGNGSIVTSSQSTDIKPDGSFRIGGLLGGTVSFSLGSWSATGNAKPIPILRVERDGVMQTNGIQLETGEHISGIRVVAAYSNGSIRGVVKVENGSFPPSGQLVITLLKVGDSNWNTNGGGIAADARGHFLIEGLATGVYEVTVSAFIPEWRQRPRITKQLVTVTDGAATDVSVTIDLTPPKKP